MYICVYIYTHTYVCDTGLKSFRAGFQHKRKTSICQKSVTFCDICDKKGMSQKSHFQICDILYLSVTWLCLFFLAKDKCYIQQKKCECHQNMALLTQTAKGLRWRAMFGSDKPQTLGIACICLLCLESGSGRLLCLCVYFRKACILQAVKDQERTLIDSDCVWVCLFVCHLSVDYWLSSVNIISLPSKYHEYYR